MEKAKQQVQEAGRSGEVSSYIADLGDLQQIRKFAEQVQNDHPEIDVLINNAGESLHLLHVKLAWPGRCLITAPQAGKQTSWQGSTC